MTNKVTLTNKKQVVNIVVNTLKKMLNDRWKDGVAELRNVEIFELYEQSCDMLEKYNEEINWDDEQ